MDYPMKFILHVTFYLQFSRAVAVVWECPAVTSIEAAKNRELSLTGAENYNSGDTHPGKI